MQQHRKDRQAALPEQDGWLLRRTTACLGHALAVGCRHVRHIPWSWWCLLRSRCQLAEELRPDVRVGSGLRSAEGVHRSFQDRWVRLWLLGFDFILALMYLYCFFLQKFTSVLNQFKHVFEKTSKSLIFKPPGFIGRCIWYFVHHTPVHLFGGGPRWGYWEASKTVSHQRVACCVLKGETPRGLARKKKVDSEWPRERLGGLKLHNICWSHRFHFARDLGQCDNTIVGGLIHPHLRMSEGIKWVPQVPNLCGLLLHKSLHDLNCQLLSAAET